MIEYDFFSERLCIGERVKGGTYKPCAQVLPYSKIRGSFKEYAGVEVDGFGIITSISNTGHITISPRDRLTDTARLPIKVMYLEGVTGKVFIREDRGLYYCLEKEFSFFMGGLKMKGFGRSRVKNKKAFAVKEKDTQNKGILGTRIPVDKAELFGIEVLKERLGYLFVPHDEETGTYVLSYFEGSLIKGPQFLIKGED